MRDVSRASHELRSSESKKAKLEELGNNISDRSEDKQVNSGFATRRAKRG